MSDNFNVYVIEGIELQKSFAEDVKSGLTAENKFLLPKYFYDTKGSELFEKICQTNEYYVTRTEAGILDNYAGIIAKVNLDKKVVIELGSGSAVKTKYILDAFLSLNGGIKYIPIDVSNILIDSSRELLRQNQKLSVDGIIGEYEYGIMLSAGLSNQPKMIIFLGSSIGNLSPAEAKKFLCFLSGYMGESDAMLIGFDMVKDTNILNKAYNDSHGYTAAFNLNLLTRINNELGGEFDLSNFEHYAYYNEGASRIEMHIISKVSQSIGIKSIGETVYFNEREAIHTENSWKFTDTMIAELASSSGLQITNSMKDENGYFSLCLFEKK